MIELDLPAIIGKIKIERELQKIFSNEMAAYLDISDKTYQRIEKMETDLSLKHFIKICEKLKKGPEYFLGREGGIYFNECHNSGNNNTYHISESNPEILQIAQSLAKLVQRQLG